MKTHADIEEFCAEAEEEVRRYSLGKRMECEAFCISNGGHYFTPWKAVSVNPVFNAVCTEERRCTACRATEVRTPQYDVLRVDTSKVFGDVLSADPFGSDYKGLVDIPAEYEDDD